MLIALFVSSIALAVLGFFVKEKKYYNLIAGYKSLSEEEKENINIEKFTNTLGIVFYILAIIFILLGLCEYVFVIPELYILAATFFVTCIGLNIITFRREDKSTRNPKTIIFLVVFDIIVVSVVVLMVSGAV